MNELVTKSKTFEEILAINVNDKTEKKGKLTYLSWAWAWAEFKKARPDATYKIMMFDGLPYACDKDVGYMVYTSVTSEDETHPMWLPVMDGNNNAMKSEKYSYEVKEWENGKPTGKMVQKFVEQATMFDINKTLMRCLTKNLAMFGLGLYIYAGEDLPEVSDEILEKAKELEFNGFWGRRFSITPAEYYDFIIGEIQKCLDLQELQKLFTAGQAEIKFCIGYGKLENKHLDGLVTEKEKAKKFITEKEMKND